MLFHNITIVNDKFEIEQGKYVAIKDDKIAYIGDKKPNDSYGREYDGAGKLLMCGFYNAHAHSPMSLMRGYGENLALQDWLTTRIFPFEDKLDSDAVYWGTMLAMAESFRFGIVSTSDMYYFCEAMARAVAESGAKANISRSVVNPMGADPRSLESIGEAVDLYEKYHNAEHGRIKIDMSLHAEYTSDEATAKELANIVHDMDTIMHIHISETELEHRECIQRHGLTPAAYLAESGLFDIPAIAAHCVYSTDDDLEIFRNKGVTIATNPVSNMKLASGICNVSKALSKGINVAIGTDSVASNNSLNFIEEMKLMAIGNKVALKDPTAVTPKEAIRAATFGGATAQGRKDCGLMKEGYKADLIVLDISQPNMYPVHNLINNIVYSGSGSDIRMTMIDGNVVYENGIYYTINIGETIARACKATEHILERL